MSKKVYVAAILLGVVLSFFLLPTMKRKEDVSSSEDYSSSHIDYEELYGNTLMESDTLRDSIRVNNQLLLFITKDYDPDELYLKEEDADRDDYLANFYQSNYEGLDTIDYNNDGYNDICFRVYKEGEEGMGKVNNFQVLLYDINRLKFSRLGYHKMHWEIFGQKGKEYKVGTDYFASPPYRELYDAKSWTYVWQSYLWKIDGLNISVLGHLECHENELYYYSRDNANPSNFIRIRFDRKKMKNLELVNTEFRKYWESNIDRLINNNFE